MFERELKNIPLEAIHFREEGRDIDSQAVERLVVSMREIGLISPVYVFQSKRDDRGVIKVGYTTMAGQHRVTAARKLGWSEIQAFVVPRTVIHLEVELIEIDENLCRSDLTSAQRSASVKRRKEIWEALHPDLNQVAQVAPPEVGYKKPPKQDKAFAAETAALTGESKSQVNRHLARAEALGDDIKEVVGTSLDKGVELDALKNLPVPERKELIQRAKAGEKVSARTKPVQPKLLIAFLVIAEQAQKLGATELGKDLRAELDKADDDLLERIERASTGFQNLKEVHDLLKARACIN